MRWIREAGRQTGLATLLVTLLALPSYAFDSYQSDDFDWDWRLIDELPQDFVVLLAATDPFAVLLEHHNMWVGNADAASTIAAIESLTPTLFPGQALDALLHLPRVLGTAVAAGSVLAIDSDNAVHWDGNQALFTVDGYYHHAALDSYLGAGTFLPLALDGTILHSTIAATSSIDRILNAAAEGSATGAGNSVSVMQTQEATAQTIGYLSQFALANVTAASTVTGVQVNGYLQLGLRGGPLAGSAATAVGNTTAISMHTPGK